MEYRAYQHGLKSSMTPGKIRQLEQAGFEWAKPKGKAAWRHKYQLLINYRERYGDCNVPTKYESDRALGRWVSTQRNQFKRYQEDPEMSTLTPENIRLLESIGFQWALSNSMLRRNNARRGGRGGRGGRSPRRGRR
mmetsp:Transcript_29093/g.81859  ORF Transcript_29093/g.81859 Transcript_29093/m.81859 type:complete len:136 (-) Transcript_29093:1-408(-)